MELAPATLVIRQVAEGIAAYATASSFCKIPPRYDLARTQFYTLVNQKGWDMAFTIMQTIADDCVAGRPPGISLSIKALRKPWHRFFHRSAPQ